MPESPLFRGDGRLTRDTLVKPKRPFEIQEWVDSVFPDLIFKERLYLRLISLIIKWVLLMRLSILRDSKRMASITK